MHDSSSVCGMVEKKSWDNIPSIFGIEIDWEHSPENPLGRRKHARILSGDLHKLLDTEIIPVRVVSTAWDSTGQLLDISQNGLAALVKNELQVGAPVKVGLFLAKQKIISKAMVRSCSPVKDKFRIGFEFFGLQKEHAEYIVGINSSRMYGSRH